MAGSRSLPVVVGLIVLLAGCSGFSPAGPGTTAPGAQTTQGLDPGVSPIYETPLNSTSVAVEHTVALQRAGSFTYSSTVQISEPNQSARYRITRMAIVEGDSGEKLITRRSSGGRTETIYDTGNGTTYVRTKSVSGALSYNRSNGSINVARYSIDGVPGFVRTFNFTYDGALTKNGTRLYRYSADGPEDFVGQPRIGGASTRNLSDVSAYAFVAESGVVRRLGYTMTFQTPRGEHVIKAETTYSALGASPVQSPEWTDEADAAAGGNLRVTRTLENESLGATLQVTALRPQFEDITMLEGPGAMYTGNGSYESAAASPAVTVLIPPGSNATFSLSYDETAVPEGGESELALYEFVLTKNAWVPVEATQNVDTNTVRTNLTRSASVVIMHEPTWNETR
ncbi:MAG: hypothetical protein ABEJ58_03555 [Halodesulfurarchaeum sp.]